jgi:hypothetical protein
MDVPESALDGRRIRSQRSARDCVIYNAHGDSCRLGANNPVSGIPYNRRTYKITLVWQISSSKHYLDTREPYIIGTWVYPRNPTV